MYNIYNNQISLFDSMFYPFQDLWQERRKEPREATRDSQGEARRRKPRKRDSRSPWALEGVPCDGRGDLESDAAPRSPPRAKARREDGHEL